MSINHITHHGIAKRLILATILVSSLLTLLITAIQIFSEYKKEVTRIDSNYEQMQLTYLPSLKESLWVIDDTQTGKILDGLLRIPEFEFISITSNGELIWQRGRHQSKQFREETIPMTVRYNNEARPVGKLKIVIGLDEIYTNLISETLAILIANGIKTFLVAGFMLFIIYSLVTRHLFKVVDYANSQNFGDSETPVAPLKLDRKKVKDDKLDELDQLVYAVNNMYERLRVSNARLMEDEKKLVVYRDHLEETVEERTEHLVAAKEEAMRANVAKTEFLSRMSHELRTPMNAVLGFTQLLELNDNLDDSQKSYIKDILDSGKHLLDLIDEVLNLTSIESGSNNMPLEPVSLRQIVFESISTIMPLAQKRNITLENKIEENDEINVMASRLHLKEVLLNLLSNAIKYGRENGDVTILYTLQPGGWVNIEVEDDGQGIDSEDYSKVFEPFSRLGAEFTEIEGTGIGLTITKRLVELMGGTIDFKSAKSKGSSFCVQLRISEGEIEIAPESEVASS